MAQKIVVSLGAPWRHFSTVAPDSVTVIGVVCRDGYDSGVLAKVEATGIYCQLNAGALREMPQKETIAAIEAARVGQRGGPGRGQGRKPADGKRGTRRQVVLDDASADTLRAYGDGDLSLGIRMAAATLPRKQ